MYNRTRWQIRNCAALLLIVDYFNLLLLNSSIRFVSKKNLDIVSFISTSVEVCFVRTQYKYLPNWEIKILKQFLGVSEKENTECVCNTCIILDKLTAFGERFL